MGLFTQPLKIDISEILNPTPKEYKLVWAHAVKLQYAQKYVKLRMDAASDAADAKEIATYIARNQKRKNAENQLNEMIKTGTNENSAEFKKQLQIITDIEKTEKELEKTRRKISDLIDDQVEGLKKVEKMEESILRKKRDVIGLEKALTSGIEKRNKLAQASLTMTESANNALQEGATHQKATVQSMLKTFGLTKDLSDTQTKIVKLQTNILDLKNKGFREDAKILESQKRTLQIINLMEKAVASVAKIHESVKKHITGIRQDWDKFKTMVSNLNPFKKLDEIFGGLLSKMMSLATNPIALLTLGVGLVIERMKKLSQATVNISRQFGIQGEQLQKMDGIAKGLWMEYRDMGVELEQMGEYIGAAVEGMGNLDYVTKKNTEMILQMNKGWGVGTQAAGEFVGMMRKMTEEGDKGAQNMMNMAKGLSDAAGVPVAKVIEDVANASDNIYGFMSGMPKKMVATAVEARRLGMTLESMGNVAKGLLDVQSSIGAEMEASIMTGKNLNFNAARRMALEGNIAGATEEVMKQMGGIEEFNKMDIYQKEAIAKATGLSIKDLAKTLEQRKEEEKLAKKRADAEKKAWELIEKGAPMFEKLISMGEKWAEFFEKIREIVMKSLKPLVEQVMNYLEKNMSKLTKIVDIFINQLFKPILNLGLKIAKDVFGKFNGELNKNEDVIDTIVKLVTKMGDVLQKSIIPFIEKLYNNFISPMVDKVVLIGKQIKEWWKGGGDAKFKTTVEAISKVIESILGAVSNLGMKMGDKAAGGIGGTFNFILDTITRIAGLMAKHPFGSLLAIGMMKFEGLRNMMFDIGKFAGKKLLGVGMSLFKGKEKPVDEKLGEVLITEGTVLANKIREALGNPIKTLDKISNNLKDTFTNKFNKVADSLKEKKTTVKTLFGNDSTMESLKKRGITNKSSDEDIHKTWKSKGYSDDQATKLTYKTLEKRDKSRENVKKTRGKVLGKGLDIGKSALGPIGNVLGSMGKIIGIVSIVATVIGGIIAGMKSFKTIMDMLTGVFEKISATFGEILDKAIMPLIDPFMKLVDSLVPIITQVATTFAELLAKLIPPIFGIIEKLVPILIELIPKLLTPVMGIIQMLVPVLADLIVTLLPPIMDIISLLAVALGDLLMSLMPPVVDLIKILVPILEMLIKLLVPVIKVVLDVLVPVINLVVKSLSIALKAIMYGALMFSEGFSKALGWVISLFDDEVADRFKQTGASMEEQRKNIKFDDFSSEKGGAFGNAPTTTMKDGLIRVNDTIIKTADKDQILATTDMQNMLQTVSEVGRTYTIDELTKQAKKEKDSNDKWFGPEANPYLKTISDVLSKYFDAEMMTFKKTQITASAASTITNGAYGGIMNASIGAAIARENAAIGANVGGAKGASSEVWQSNTGKKFVANSAEYVGVINPHQVKALSAMGLDQFSNKSGGGMINFAKGGALSKEQIAGYAKNAGFPESELPMSVAIAMAESGGDPGINNKGMNTNGTVDYGLWQINTIHKPKEPEIYDPKINAGFAFNVWSGAGKKWTPWSSLKKVLAAGVSNVTPTNVADSTSSASSGGNWLAAMIPGMAGASSTTGTTGTTGAPSGTNMASEAQGTTDAKDLGINGQGPIMKLFYDRLKKLADTEKMSVAGSSTRTHAQQIATKAAKGKMAATPGRSRHEYGLAVDLTPGTLRSQKDNSILNKYGLDRPLYPPGRATITEDWHIEPLDASGKRIPLQAGAALFKQLNGVDPTYAFGGVLKPKTLPIPPEEIDLSQGGYIKVNSPVNDAIIQNSATGTTVTPLNTKDNVYAAAKSDGAFAAGNDEISKKLDILIEAVRANKSIAVHKLSGVE